MDNQKINSEYSDVYCPIFDNHCLENCIFMTSKHFCALYEKIDNSGTKFDLWNHAPEVSLLCPLNKKNCNKNCMLVEIDSDSNNKTCILQKNLQNGTFNFSKSLTNEISQKDSDEAVNSLLSLSFEEIEKISIVF